MWEALHPQERQRFEGVSVFDVLGIPKEHRILCGEDGVPIEDAASSGASRATTQPRTSSRGRVGEGRPQEFAAETAAITGESKSQINRQLAVANALGDDLHRVEGTSLDKGVELAALAKMAGPERKLLIDKAQAGDAVSARHAPPPPALAAQLASVINRAAGEIVSSVGYRSIEALMHALERAELSTDDKAVLEASLGRLDDVITEIGEFVYQSYTQTEVPA